MKKADAFVKGLQWDEDEKTDPSDVAYGGGYGKHKRPDHFFVAELAKSLEFRGLSKVLATSATGFETKPRVLVDTLKSAGNTTDSEAIQLASRCQNLETAHNTTAFSAKMDRLRVTAASQLDLTK